LGAIAFRKLRKLENDELIINLTYVRDLQYTSYIKVYYIRCNMGGFFEVAPPTVMTTQRNHPRCPSPGWRNTTQDVIQSGLVAWRSGNALCPINEVVLRRAALVLGWVTACGQVSHLCM